MFKKQNRLSRVLIEELIKGGRRVNSPYFDVVYKPAAEGKVSVSVSKKTAKTAVSRHKIRRRLFAALREVTLPKAHLLIIAKRQVETVPYQELYSAMEKVVGQIKPKAV